MKVLASSFNPKPTGASRQAAQGWAPRASAAAEKSPAAWWIFPPKAVEIFFVNHGITQPERSGDGSPGISSFCTVKIHTDGRDTDGLCCRLDPWFLF